MYETFVGLEIHIHLLTETKVFCGCKAHYGDEPNSNICPVCMGYPGVLPVLNEQAIKLAYVVAQALNCQLSRRTVFERKNYFYPDLPKNYQISQFRDPVGENGFLDFPLGDGKTKRVRIHDVHLEEDAGKMIHAGDMTLCDYNRTGYPLLEIVTEPDLSGGEEAEKYLQYFQRLVRYLNVCDGNMEEGSLRCDANISINTPGAGLGIKVEIKNLNSSRFVRKALDFEFKRQSGLFETGGRISQETRLWNENRDVTETMRSKESSHDYRYFPEPDLPPFIPSQQFLQTVSSLQVELPLARRERFQKTWNLTNEQLDFVSENKSIADYFERTVSACGQGSLVANWLMGDVQKELKHFDLALDTSPLTSDRLAQLLILQESGRIHIKIAKQVLIAVFEENKDPEAIIKEKGWEAITSESQLEPIVDKVFAEQATVVAAVRAGDQRQKGFLVGQVMQATGGRATPALVNQLLSKKLS